MNRIKVKKFYHKNGSVAILLTLLFLSLIVAFFAIVEGSGRIGLKSTAEASYDLAGRSILSTYDLALLKSYGLMAFQADNKILSKKMEKYANATIESKDMLGGSSKITGMETAKFSIGKPDNFMAEIRAMNKELILRGVLSEWEIFLNDASAFNEGVKRKTKLDKDMDSMSSSLEAEYRRELEKEENENTDENTDESKKRSMSLGEIISIHRGLKDMINEGETKEIDNSDENVVLRNQSFINDLPSTEAGCRKNGIFKGVADITSSMLTENSGKKFWDNLLSTIYVMEYFNNHLDEKSDNRLFRNEIEYILYGEYSDEANYRKAYQSIFIMRMGINVSFLMTDTVKRSETLAMAELITPGPWATLTQMLIIGAWGTAESIYDMNQLEDGQGIPYIKDSITWHTDLKGLLKGYIPEGKSNISHTSSNISMHFNNKVIEKNWNKSMNNTNLELVNIHNVPECSLSVAGIKTCDYNQYLMFLLFMEDRDTKLYRVMDLIQLNMKGTDRSDFLIEDHCIGFSMEAQVVKKNFSHNFFKLKDKFKVVMTHTYIDIMGE